MPKPQADKEINKARPDGQVELVVANAPEPDAPEMVTLIHPRTGQGLPTVPHVAKWLVDQGWEEKT